MTSSIIKYNGQEPKIEVSLSLKELKAIVKWGGEADGDFELYTALANLADSQELLPPKILKKVTFVYVKGGYEATSWRTVEVITETPLYIEGLEDGDFKRFLKSKILGGKILSA